MIPPNPQEFAMNMLKEQAGDNPVLNNAMKMANQDNFKGIEQLARNVCNDMGISPEKIMQQASNQIQQILRQFGIR